MADYEVRTPLLLESIEVYREVLNGLRQGKIAGVDAGRMIAAANGFQRAVAIDIKARTAHPWIITQESKNIDVVEQRVLERRRAASR